VFWKTCTGPQLRQAVPGQVGEQGATDQADADQRLARFWIPLQRPAPVPKHRRSGGLGVPPGDHSPSDKHIQITVSVYVAGSQRT
jgi:hypothetical protein